MACSIQPFSFSSGLVPSFSPEQLALSPTDPNYVSGLGWCMFSQLLSNVLGFLAYLVTFTAAIAIIWGAITLVISVGNPEKIKKGKKIIISALTGVAIVYSANAILKAVYIALGYSGVLPGF